MKEYIEIFKALSDETRLRILHLLIKTKLEICCCELADSLEVPQCNISRHIKILKHAGLVEERKEGRWVYFRITRDKSPFFAGIIKSISSIPEPLLAKDEKELEKRLDIRIDGKCLLGIKKKYLIVTSGKHERK